MDHICLLNDGGVESDIQDPWKWNFWT